MLSKCKVKTRKTIKEYLQFLKHKSTEIPKICGWMFPLPPHFLPLFRYQIMKFFTREGSIPQSPQSFLKISSSDEIESGTRILVLLSIYMQVFKAQED